MNDSEMMTKARRKGLSIYRAYDGWWTITHPNLFMIKDENLMNHLSCLPNAGLLTRFLIWTELR